LISLTGKLLNDTGIKGSDYTGGKYCFSEYQNSLDHTTRFPILNCEKNYGCTNGKKYRFVVSFAPAYKKIITFLQFSKHLPGEQDSEKILRNSPFLSHYMLQQAPYSYVVLKRNYSRKLFNGQGWK